MSISRLYLDYICCLLLVGAVALRVSNTLQASWVRMTKSHVQTLLRYFVFICPTRTDSVEFAETPAMNDMPGKRSLALRWTNRKTQEKYFRLPKSNHQRSHGVLAVSDCCFKCSLESLHTF